MGILSFESCWLIYSRGAWSDGEHICTCVLEAYPAQRKHSRNEFQFALEHLPRHAESRHVHTIRAAAVETAVTRVRYAQPICVLHYINIPGLCHPEAGAVRRRQRLCGPCG